MAYTRIDKNTATKIAAEVAEVLKKYGLENGLEYSRVGGGKFTESDFEFKINMKIAGAKTFGEQKADANLRMALLQFDLTDEVVNGQQIVRFDRSKYKYPVIYRGRDGKQYKTSIEHAKFLFGKK
jgi:uncharacterized protein (DUF1919 family)